MSKKIAFANNKGGVLKTSLTVNYASVLSKRGYKVLIIDTDSQSNVLSSFGKFDRSQVDYTLNDLVFYNKKIEDSLINVYENIDVITPGDEWRDFETQLTQRIIQGKPFKNINLILEEIDSKFNYDYILFDTEPKKSSNTFQVLLACDEVIIPFTLEAYGLEALIKMRSYIEEAQKHNEKLIIKAQVACKTATRNKMENMIREQASKLPKPGLCELSIPNSVTGASSTTLKKLPIYLTSKNKLSKSYEALVNLLEFNIREEN